MQTQKKLVKGNEAIAMAAIEAGCRYYFGYPITPQSDIPELLSREFPKLGGVFLQAESEVASINMVMGAGGTGKRVMTSSSGPGISLMQEGISYMAGSEIPGVIVNIERSGPGLGGISPSQGDYFQATRGGGHGDYRTPALAPDSVQEMWDLTFLAFDLADKYRTPAVILADAMLGQMKEALEIKVPQPLEVSKDDWKLEGCKGRDPRKLKSLFLGDGDLEKHCWHLDEKYEKIKRDEVRYEAINTEDAEILVVAFGSAARIAKTSIREARKQGIKAGLLRPITIYPFPVAIIDELSQKAKAVVVVELNTGQMLEDVKIAVGKQTPIRFYGRPNGVGSLPRPDDILNEIKQAFPA